MKGNWNWTEVEESSNRLEPGFYVLEIKEANDGRTTSTGAETLELVYDIAEGANKGHYSDEWGRNNSWAHTDRRYYGTDKTNGMFKSFLNVLESSNPSFTVAGFGNDNGKLVGLKYGVAMQKRFYTNNDGEDKEALEIVRTYPVAKVMEGGLTLPEPRDDREGKPKAEDAPTLYGDVPF